MKDNKEHKSRLTKKKRKFPWINAVILIICILIQTASIAYAVTYPVEPDDIIKSYTVTVEPADNGTLNIRYDLEWQAVSVYPLTWVEIGVANPDFTIVDSSVSSTVKGFKPVIEEDYYAVYLEFAESYSAGETVKFSFTVNQGSMLCKSIEGYFYRFVPSWFNKIPVEK